MLITELYNFIHKNKIVSQHLQSFELVGYVDQAIDDINNKLQTIFPTFSEWPDFCVAYNEAHPDEEQLNPAEYTAIPAKYLRAVVATGAALYFFTNDEEGEAVSLKFSFDYEKNIQLMLRDYINKVPTMYLLEEGSGYIDTKYPGRESGEASITGVVYRDEL